MYSKSLNIKKVLSNIDELNPQGNEAIFIGLTSGSSKENEELLLALKNENVNFFGGVFPGLLHNCKYFENGLILQKFPLLTEPFIIPDTKIGSTELRDLVDLTDKNLGGKSLLIFVDGFASGLPQIFNNLSNITEEKITVFGAFAGNHFQKNSNNIFDKTGFHKNCAVGTILDCKINGSLGHGFRKISAPVTATKTHNNIVSELNWDEAFTVYADYLKLLGRELKLSEFFETANNYPLAFFSGEEDFVLRDVLKVNEKGELICGAEIPENSVLAIMGANKIDLIKCAANAALQAKVEKSTINSSFVFYSYSRMKLLGDNFEKELEAVKKNLPENTESHGVTTHGEIYFENGKNGKVNNKSILIGNLYE